MRPAVDGDRLYLDYEFEGPVVGVDRRTGAELWRYEHPYNSPSSLELDNGRLFFAGVDAVALDAASGAELWRRPLNALAGLGFTTVHDGKFLVGTDSLLYALDVDTGDSVWVANLSNGFEHLSVVRGIARSGDTLYVNVEVFTAPNGVTGVNHLLAMRADNGEILWRFVDSHIMAKRGSVFEPSVSDELVFVGDFWGRDLVAVDRLTGLVRYRIPNLDASSSGPFEAPKFSGDTGFFGTGDGQVAAFDVNTGEIHWRIEAGGTMNTLVLCGPFVVVSDQSTTLLDRDNGKILKRDFQLSGSTVRLLITRFVQRGNDFYAGGNNALWAFRCRN